MQKKYWIAPGIIGSIVVASLMALSSPKTVTPEEQQTCCKKTLKKCPSQKETSVPEQTSLDNLSNQFILIPLRPI